MNNWLFILPFISAFIGWLMVRLLVKLLFHPQIPKNIFGITIQGILPKHWEQFASKLGKFASNELFSFDEVEKKISDPENFKSILPQLETHIDHFLRVKLSSSMPMISMFIGDKTIEKLKSVFLEELEELFPKIMKQYAGTLMAQLDIEQIVAEKVKSFSTDKLEEILYNVMAKEFRFVEITGAVLGFIIGLLQIVITLLTQ